MVETTVLTINSIVRTPGICGGVPRIDGTRITVDWVVGQIVYAGATIEGMVEDYAHIPLLPAQLHAALAYYYSHQDEIDDLIDTGERLLETVKARSQGTDVTVSPGYITAREAADILDLDHRSRQVAHLCRQGILEGKKIANRWMVSRASVERYTASERKPGPKPSGG